MAVARLLLIVLAWLVLLGLSACSQTPIEKPVVQLPAVIEGFADSNAAAAIAKLQAWQLAPARVPIGKDIAAIGKTLEQVLPANTFRFRYTLLNTLSVNAVASPDGQLMMTAGLVAVLDDPDVMAALIAHQMGHLVAGHRIATAAAPTADNYLAALHADERALVSTLERMAFSAAQELEADAIATELLHLAGYDPGLYRQFLATLNDLGGGHLVSLATSHPNVSQRLAAQPVESGQAAYASRDDHNGYRSHLNGSAIYTPYGGLRFNSTGIGYTDTGTVISFAEAIDWQNASADRGTVRLGKRYIAYQLFSGEQRRQEMLQSLDAYNVDVGDIVKRSAFFRAKSWLTDSRCLLLESRTLQTVIVVFTETVNGNCDSVPHPGFGFATTEQWQHRQIEQYFKIRLGYRPTNDRSSDFLMQTLYGGQAQRAQSLLNTHNRVPDKVKLLY